MFGLFKNKSKGPQLTHHVYMNKIGKFRNMMEQLDKVTALGNQALLLYYFDETGNHLKELLQAANLSYGPEPSRPIHLVKIDQLDAKTQFMNRVYSMIVVAEIHPMGGKDELLCTMLQPNSPNIPVIFYTSVDSPLMQAFGGNKVESLMKSMGMGENEKIEHGMISKSIARAQEKVKAKVLFEKPAASKQEWMELNVKPKE